jgi:hypothetical protein
VTTLEKVVLVTALAVRALQAADQQHRDSYRHKDGEDIRICREPMDQAVHIGCTAAYSKKTLWIIGCTFLFMCFDYGSRNSGYRSPDAMSLTLLHARLILFVTSQKPLA